MPDTAGNSLATATQLSLTSAIQSFPDLVTPSANDYYRFSLSAPSSLNLTLTGLDANADVELLDANGNPVTVGGVVQRSANPGVFSEVINTALNPGVYFVRVAPGDGIAVANYTLNIAAQDNLLSSDILWRNEPAGATFVWVLDQANNVVSTQPLSLAVGPGWLVGGVGDFNNDGNTDIIWRSKSDGALVLFYMNQSQFLSFEAIAPKVDFGWQIGGTGDFNQDGNVDIVWRNDASSATLVWAMDGASIISTDTITPQVQGPGWAVNGVGDFNGDGNVDLVWRNRTAAVSFVWFMDGVSLLSSTVVTPDPGANWYIAGTGDFNRDGQTDLLWRDDISSGAVYLWLMDGTTVTSTIALPSVQGADWQPFGAYYSYGTPNPIDLAGNTTGAAFDLGTGIRGEATYRDRVGGTDTDDYFRFNVDRASLVKLDLGNLNANLNLQLLDSTGAVIQSSTLGDLAAETISRTLNAGTYFLRVFPNSTVDNGTYSLAVSVNNIPILVTNNPLTVNEEGSATIGSGVLTVTDPDNSAAQLVYTVGNLPLNGALTVNGAIATAGTTFTQSDLEIGGRIQYTHNGSETLSDRFTFTVSDGAGGTISLSTFSIVVNPVNDPPVLATNLGLTLSEGDESSITAALLQITDPDNPPAQLTYQLTTPPTHGTLLLSGTAVTSFTQADLVSGNLTYAHNGSEAPTDQFTFTITDGVIPSPLGPSVFTITILPVNDAPTVSVNTPLTVSEGTTAVITPNRLLATDPDGPTPLTYTLEALPTNGTLRRGNQTLSVGQTFTQADIRDGQITYLHNGTETTSDSFQFSLSDGAGATSPLLSFSINVLPVNDAPVLTVPGAIAADQEANTLIQGIQITDADANPGEVTVTLSAGNGLLSLGRTTGITFITGDGTQDQTFSFRGAQDVTNFVLQSLIYRSNTGFAGSDTINVTVSDGGNTGLGGVQSDTDIITLNVAPVNDAPVITVPGPRTIAEDVSTTITGISIGDLDAGNGNLTVSVSVANGTVSLSSTNGIQFSTGTGNGDKNLVFSGNLSAINTVLSGLRYQGDRDFNGNDTLTISVSDNGNTGNGISLSDTKAIALTITPQNDAPVLTVPATQSVNENSTLRITGISVNDVDVAGGDLTVALSVSDGQLSLNSTTGLTFDSGDGTGDTTMIFRGAQAAVNDALRTLLYQPGADFNGTDTVSVSVSDGGNTGFGVPLGDADAIAINVLGINNAPVITVPTGALAVDSDTELTITGVSVADADAGPGVLSVSLVAANGILTLANTSGLTFSQGDGTADNRMTFSGTLFAINAALNELTYRSYPGFTNQFDRITLSVSDNGSTGIGVPLSDSETFFVNVGNAVNIAPVATNDTYTVAEEGTLNATSVLANDSDPDFTVPLTAQIVAGPANAGTFTLNANGTFTYAPAANFSGADTFTYRAIDALGSVSNTATVVINVSNVNDPPTAANDGFTLAEDTPFTTGNVLANDTDPDTPPPLAAQLIQGPANAANFALNSDGSFSYTPRANFSGGDRFTYVAVDLLGGTSNTATVSLTVTPVNDAPIANNDGTYRIGAGGTLSVTTTNGVLANDTDIDGPALTASVVTGPANGTLSLNPNGSFTYRPTGTFAGVDTFTYQASDGSLTSNLATATISVSTNNPPTANPDSFTLPEDGSLTVGNVLTNDTDLDGNTPLSASLVVGPTNGTLSLNPDGTFSYTPNANFSGADSFTYRAVDSLGESSNPTTVSFNVTAVNDAPVAVNDTLSVSPGGTLSLALPGVLANDTDIDTPTANLTAVLVSTTGNGTLSLNGNGSFVYRPNAGFVGTDSFTYRVNDGSLGSANTATVAIAVDPTANTPPAASTDTFTTAEDTPLTVGNVLANDSDPDNNTPLTASVVAGPSNALSFTLNSDGTFSYTPNANFSGVDTFVYQAIDSLGGVSTPTTVTFSVTAVNDAPVATNDVFTVSNTASLAIAAPGVLSNDTDIDSPNLSATLVSNVTSGTLSLNADGSFTYRPNAGFEGVDSFTYRANDGSLNSANTATVNITVAAVVNTPPIATADTFTTPEDPTSPLTGNVLTNDTDPDGGTAQLTAVLVGAAPTSAASFTLNPDGTFRYTPNANFNGVDTFTYVARDSLGATSTVAIATLSVTPVADNPLAVGDSYTVKPTETLTITAPGILVNDTDPDGSPLTASVISSVGSGTLNLNSDGSFTYVPQPTEGVVSFTYVANDGTANSNTATVTITISANTPPQANPDIFNLAEDTSLTIGNVLANDTDPDGGGLSLTASVGAPPANAASFTLNPDGSFSYTPNANFSGIDTFTYTALDSLGGRSNTATVTFSVAPANDLPLATNDTVTVNVGSSLTLTAPGVLANDTDPENNPLTASVVSNVTNGTLSLNGDGSFTYTPNAGFSGTDSFTYVANDGTGNSAPATVSIRVNAPPTALSDTYTAVIGGTLNVDPLSGVLVNDTDVDNSNLTAAVVTNPTQGTLSLNSNGSFSYVPNAGASGTDTFTYRASDGAANSTATVTLSLRTNTAPIANPDSYRAPTNGTLTVNALTGVLNNDTDADAGTQLSATIATNATRGTVSLNADGSFVYTPNAGFQGTDSFTYRASDGVTVSGPATVTLTVAPNNPPIVQNDSYNALSNVALTVQQTNGVLLNDTDPDSNPLQVTVVTGPTGGTVTLNPDGSFVYLSNTNFQGVDTFTYRAFDGLANATATVTLSVTLNQPPTAQPDVYNAIAGQTLTVTNPGVLVNDNDPEGTLFAIAGGVRPSNGTLLSFSNNGSFTYVPNTGFTGVDSFTYQASDNVSTSAPVTVTITVANNAPPVAQADAYDVNPNTTLTVPRTLGLLANDTDPNVSQPLSASVVTSPTKGVLSLNADGSFTYTPNAGASGTDTFTYRATDGSLNSTAGVTITINATSSPPTVQNDTYTVAANSTLTVTAAGVLANDTDPDGDVIQATLSTNGTNGTATLNANGAFVYRPNANFTGTDSFTYVANDGLNNSTPATVFVTVGGANAAPVVTTPGNQLTNQNTDLVISSGLSIADGDAGTAPIQVTLAATNGTLSLSGITGLTFTTGDGTGDATMVFTGAIAAINTALANLRFTPTAGFTGTAQITLAANDQGATGSGGPQTGNGTVTVNVASGATLVTNISPGSGSASPANLTSVGNQIFFAATDGSTGVELWKSGGTAATTTQVADLNTGTGNSSPANLTVVGNRLYYTATNSATGTELYSTDLTTGTGGAIVRDLRSGFASSSPQSLVNFNGTLFFRASDGTATGTNVLWKTDGTSAGTVRVGAGFSQTNNLTVVGNTLYFTAGNGTQLWKTDGTDAGTVLVKDLGTGANLQNLRAVDGTLVFTANDANGVELWSSGGTDATTNRATDLNPGAGSSNPNNLVVLNGSLYFFAQDATNGAYKLYQRTAAGVTTAIATLPNTGLAPAQLTVVGNRLFFVVDTGTAGSPSLQLFSSDGTSAALVRDVNAAGNDAIASLTNVNGTLFFVANDGTGFKVFRSDGTAAGTVAASGNFTTAPSNLATANGRLYFAATDATNGTELWTIG